jgi:glucose-6-phosphate 1-dehydrogenase
MVEQGGAGGGVASNLSVVVLGASGDLAKKKTYPALFGLFLLGKLPPKTRFVGYSRTELTSADFVERIRKYLKGSASAISSFLEVCTYVTAPSYESVEGAQALAAHLDSFATEGVAQNRLFYMALPPVTFVDATTAVSTHAQSKTGWNRFVVEKPFGQDLESSNQLSQQLSALLSEDQIYRIDHYLGKGMVQNIMMMRFGNIFEHLWNNQSIANVLINFKEDIGTDGRGGYFDSIGIMRDVMQNHLLQVLSLIAMEPPASTSSEHIRDAKVAVLKCIEPLSPEDTIMGQYTGFTKKEPGRKVVQDGYLDDPTVPPGSKCATFCATVFHINNERWRGVPFIMRAGKALNERKMEIRIQFKESSNLFSNKSDVYRNELVLRVQPRETIYFKVMSMIPGLAEAYKQTDLDMTILGDSPDAYLRLILEVIEGDQQHFVRTDELQAAWAIFDNVLKHSFEPEPYVFGSRGPASADGLALTNGCYHPYKGVAPPAKISSQS